MNTFLNRHMLAHRWTKSMSETSYDWFCIDLTLEMWLS